MSDDDGGDDVMTGASYILRHFVLFHALSCSSFISCILLLIMRRFHALLLYWLTGLAKGRRPVKPAMIHR
jgi:hypothetical protein